MPSIPLLELPCIVEDQVQARYGLGRQRQVEQLGLKASRNYKVRPCVGVGVGGRGGGEARTGTSGQVVCVLRAVEKY